MALSPFLENLKKSVDTGDFNSEAAKKIIEVDKLADERKSTRALDFAFDAAIKEGAIKSVTEEEAAALNVDYEKKMLEIKEKDAENKRIADLIDAAEKQTATLIEIEDMVQLSINDMMGFIVDLETNFSKEIQENNPIFTDLTQQIAKIKSKYSSINN
jgi:hypothetical protein